MMRRIADQYDLDGDQGGKKFSALTPSSQPDPEHVVGVRGLLLCVPAERAFRRRHGRCMTAPNCSADEMKALRGAQRYWPWNASDTQRESNPNLVVC